MNVFNNPWKFARAPLKWFKYFFRSFKYAYQRATKGYCDCDVWECFDYYTHVISGTLHELADNHMGHPDDMTPESWTATLHEIAEHLEKSLEENELLPQPKTDEWNEAFERAPNILLFDGGRWISVDDELTKAMHKEQEELRKLRSAEKDMALDMLKKYWYHLWD